MVKKNTYFPIFFVLLACSLIVLSLSRFTVFQDFLLTIISPVQQNLISAFHTTDNKKIVALEEKNILLTEQLVNEKKLQQENIALHDQFASNQIPNRQLLAAHIVSIPSFIPGISFPEYIIIDKGQADAIKIGQAVVYRNMAIGLVNKVSDHFSQVSLLTNSSATFSVTTMATNALGIIKGQGNTNLILDNVLPSDHLRLDDLVITKGSQKLDGTDYPPGLVVGKITAIEKNPTALFQKARVHLTIDIPKLTMVFVIVNK